MGTKSARPLNGDLKELNEKVKWLCDMSTGFAEKRRTPLEDDLEYTQRKVDRALQRFTDEHGDIPVLVVGLMYFRFVRYLVTIENGRYAVRTLYAACEYAA